MINNNQNKNWYLVDASKNYLGRIATGISKILIGKDKVNYQPNSDTGDYVVVINSNNIKLSGNKESSKRYYKHSGHLGSTKTIDFTNQLKEDSTKIIMEAVRGMLPKNKLLKKRMARLKIYKNDKHPHQNIKFVN